MQSDSTELIAFLQARGHQLVELHLEGRGRDNDAFDNEPFQSLHAFCPNLQVLDVVNCYAAERYSPQHIRPDASDVFQDMGDDVAFGAVCEREMNCQQWYVDKIRNYSHMQFGTLHSNRLDFK